LREKEGKSVPDLERHRLCFRSGEEGILTVLDLEIGRRVAKADVLDEVVLDLDGADFLNDARVLTGVLELDSGFEWSEEEWASRGLDKEMMRTEKGEEREIRTNLAFLTANPSGDASRVIAL
jgi:hypothetical protein